MEVRLLKGQGEITNNKKKENFVLSLYNLYGVSFYFATVINYIYFTIKLN